MKINEDQQFLLRQREKGRPSCVLGVDIKTTNIKNTKLLDKMKKEKEKYLNKIK
jgi:hypothetical protein